MRKLVIFSAILIAVAGQALAQSDIQVPKLNSYSILTETEVQTPKIVGYVILVQRPGGIIPRAPLTHW